MGRTGRWVYPHDGGCQVKGFGLFGVSIAAGEIADLDRQRDMARERLLTEIRSAREQGASWGEIGRAMGTGEATPRVMVGRADRAADGTGRLDAQLNRPRTADTAGGMDAGKVGFPCQKQ